LLVQINDQGKIRVPGFYDSVVMPTELEKQILQQLPDVEAEMEQVFGVKPVVPEGSTYYEHFLYSPTFNVSGLNAGYTGKGRKTIVPAQASAKVDMRLVPNQDPQEIFELVSAYIEQMGYDNVSVRKLGAVHPSRTPLDTPYLEAFKAATVDTFDGYIIYPRRAATGPDYVWTQILHKPVIQVRYSDADSANHSPNEKLKIDTFLKGIELAARVASYISKM